MIYKETKPHPALAGYIDAFWTATAEGGEPASEKILPDGCVDIILSVGEDCKTDNGTFHIKNGEAYLVGTMKNFKLTEMMPETRLLGIRFKPSAFSAFYNFSSLHEVTDITIEFERNLAPDLKQVISNSSEYLNKFFLDRLRLPRHMLLPVIADIKDQKGQINVTELAKRHCITTRQLERSFKQYVGMSPKEFINLARYQFVLPLIKKRSSDSSLLKIAVEHGYYDHAHLGNEIKRYTGLAPTQL